MIVMIKIDYFPSYKHKLHCKRMARKFLWKRNLAIFRTDMIHAKALDTIRKHWLILAGVEQ
jgi:hypothetical protein